MRGAVDKATLRRLGRILLIVAVIWLAIVLLSPFYQLGINRTDSLPGLVYVIDKRHRPGKGELVAFWPPANRLYTRSWFVKRVVGVAGDEVTADADNRVFVGGRLIGTAKRQSRTGIPLMAPVVGVIPSEHFFAATGHPDGFDSRYGDIGFIHVDRIIGRAYRIL